MNIKIGEKIKLLRKKADITQDKFAEYLGITPQAVSRWENESAYPDIEIIPAIANFFNVTTDELLGVDQAKNKKRIEKIYGELNGYSTKGLHDKKIEVLRKALQEFPNDYGLLNSLAHSLSDKSWSLKESDEKQKLQEEAIAISERIAADCTDMDMRYSVLQGLAYEYKNIGNKEKAVETANKLPNIYCTRDAILANILKGEEKFKQLKCNITNFTDMLSQDYVLLAREKYANARYFNEKVMLYNKAIKVFEILCEDGDYGFYNGRLSGLYFTLCKVYLEAKDINGALNHLEKAVYHCIELDKPEAFETNQFFKHTSIIFEREPGDESQMFYSRTANCNSSYGMLADLKDERFDELREENKFEEIIAKLEQYAKIYE